MRNIVYISIFLFCCVTTQAQQVSYNITKATGLPTNRVYCHLVDHNGYLWIGTERGVLRYNGYSLKKFDFSDGLPNIDVWHLHEDPYHRIVLSSFSRQPGYIKNDKFHPFVVKGMDSSVKFIAQKFFHSKDDTLWFYNMTGSWMLPTTGYIVGDTLYHIKKPDIIERHIAMWAHSPEGMIASFDNNKNLYKYNIKNNRYTDTVLLCKNIPDVMRNRVSMNLTDEQMKLHEIFHVDNKSFFHINHENKTYYIDFDNCHFDSVQVLPISPATPQKIIFCHPIDQNNTSIVTQDSIYILNTDLSIRSFGYEELTGIKELKGNSAFYILHDSLWGKGLATPSNGLYLTFENDAFKKIDYLSNYTYLGRKNDSTSIWQDKRTNTLATLCNETITKERTQKTYSELYSLQKLDDNHFFVFDRHGVTIVDYKTQNKYKRFSDCKKFTFIDPTYNIHSNDRKTYQWFINGIKSVVVIDSNNLYGLGGGINGLFQFSIKDEDSFVITRIDEPKYNKIAYSKKHQYIFAFNDFTLLVYDILHQKKTIFSVERLREAGINQIIKIIADDYGNIFIQDYDKLLLVDINKLKVKNILPSYNMEGAIVELLNNKLTIAGTFGVIQYQINGHNNIQLDKTYRNTKGLFYNYVVSMFTTPDEAILTTNNGIYSVDLTRPNKKREHDKIFVYNNKDTSYQLFSNDTITLLQKDKQINIDLINPEGYGALRMQYKLPNKNEWTQAEGKDINLYQLKPGFHKIKIQASDDIWKSRIIDIYIYITPYWWQTVTGKLTIGSTLLLAVIILVFIAIAATKKIVSKNNERKNQQRNLELKSIYSQINPHFIFNTLSTALFFVKKNQNEAAAKHISQFSELLRAYLKSSRNKYISISEETENLDNYLQLQMSRFDEKIQYEITVENAIDANETMIPSLLLQPIVENSLNHGIFHKAGIGKIKIDFKQGANERETICIVDDNGIGRKKAKLIRNTAKADSYGTILIDELIETFNKYEPIFITIDYIDKEEPDTGTTVIITIKNKKNV
ncbi:MAG: histidine kinase [Flavipsychrobacter sp.]